MCHYVACTHCIKYTKLNAITNCYVNDTYEIFCLNAN